MICTMNRLYPKTSLRGTKRFDMSYRNRVSASVITFLLLVATCVFANGRSGVQLAETIVSPYLRNIEPLEDLAAH